MEQVEQVSVSRRRAIGAGAAALAGGLGAVALPGSPAQAVGGAGPQPIRSAFCVGWVDDFANPTSFTISHRRYEQPASGNAPVGWVNLATIPISAASSLLGDTPFLTPEGAHAGLWEIDASGAPSYSLVSQSPADCLEPIFVGVFGALAPYGTWWHGTNTDLAPAGVTNPRTAPTAYYEVQIAVAHVEFMSEADPGYYASNEIKTAIEAFNYSVGHSTGIHMQAVSMYVEVDNDPASSLDPTDGTWDVGAPLHDGQVPFEGARVLVNYVPQSSLTGVYEAHASPASWELVGGANSVQQNARSYFVTGGPRHLHQVFQRLWDDNTFRAIESPGVYAPANPGHWPGTVPTGLSEALDLIAARLDAIGA